jgi:WD40 repeat protein
VQHPYSLRHLFFNRTGTIIFGADSSEIARAYAWDLASGSLLPIFSTGTVQTFVWNNRHDAIASIRLADIEIRDATTLEIVQRIQLPKNPSSTRSALYDIGVALWSQDDKYLILGSINGRVRVWDLSQNRLVTEIQGNDAPRLSTETSSIRSLSYSPSGKHLYSLSVDGTFRVWNTADYSIVATEQLAAPSLPRPQWSRFGGRLVYIPANAGAVQAETISGVTVLVPYPTLDDVQSLIIQCVKDTTTKSNLEWQADTNLSQLVNSLRQLPADAIPPACAADLLAIVEALPLR